MSGYVRDENETPVAGARITVRPAVPSSAGPWHAETGLGGAFSLTLLGARPGDYLVNVER